MTTRKISVAVLAGLAVLSLSACHGTKSAEAAASKTASTTTEELVPNACGDETYRTAHAEYCNSVDPLPEDPADLNFSKVGDVISFDGGNTVGTVQLVSVRREVETDQGMLDARHETGSYLIAEVLVKVGEVRNGEPALISGYDFSAQDPAGNVYDVTYTPLSDMLSKEIGAGRQVRGEVAFDVPQGDVIIDWSPGFAGPLVSWKVNG